MQCTATRVDGKRCTASAIRGGLVCRMHGGAAPQIRAKAAVRAEVLSWGLGDATDDPGETLLRLLTQSRQRAELLAAEVDRKVAAGRAEWGEEFDLERILVGATFVAAGEDAVKSGEYIRGLVQLEAQERDRCAGFAAKAIAAGLAERQVRLAERQGEMIAAVLSAVMADAALGLTAEQREAFPHVIRRQLEAAR